MKKNEQNKSRKKKKILDAAQRVFLSDGFINTSMDKIAIEAEVTKQTVYRYYSSKIELFKATLEEMGKSSGASFLQHLANPDTHDALLSFAKAFIRFHTSDEHIATFRLLVSESSLSPEITMSFFDAGPDHITDALKTFFADRFKLKNSEILIRLWTGMLLEGRNGVLVGMKKPTRKQMDNTAIAATELLLATLNK